MLKVKFSIINAHAGCYCIDASCIFSLISYCYTRYIAKPSPDSILPRISSTLARVLLLRLLFSRVVRMFLNLVVSSEVDPSPVSEVLFSYPSFSRTDSNLFTALRLPRMFVILLMEPLWILGSTSLTACPVRLTLVPVSESLSFQAPPSVSRNTARKRGWSSPSWSSSSTLSGCSGPSKHSTE